MSEPVPSSLFVQELLDVLESRFGHDLTSRQLARTLAGAGFLACDAQPERLQDYLTLLRTLPLEAPLVQALVQPATNNESYFFRDAPTMASLREQILPPLLEAASATRVFRVWSAGCGAGEELYTISILLHELVPDLDSWTIALVGTDIDGGALARARVAQYGEWALRATSPEQRQRYFRHDAESKRYALHPRYRHGVSFGLHNLVDPSVPPPAPGCFDLVLCRNVSIYFTPPARAALDRKLQGALSSGGCWIAGPSDPLPTCGVQVRVLPGMLAFRRPVVGSRPRSSQRPVTKLWSLPAPARAHSTQPAPSPAFSARPVQLPSIAPAVLSPVSPAVAARASSTTARLQPASIGPTPHPLSEQQLERLALARAHADRNELHAAHEILDDLLNDDALVVGAYLLRADLFEAEGNAAAALEALRCAVYLDARLLEAHFRIGLVLERLGDTRGAIIALRNAAALGGLPHDAAATGLAQLAAMRMTLLLTEQTHGR